jgi:hypothetical protein
VGYALDAFGIFAVQRQLIRTMASLFITSSRKKKRLANTPSPPSLKSLATNYSPQLLVGWLIWVQH